LLSYAATSIRGSLIMNRMIPANERDSELSLYGYLTSVVTGGVAWAYNPIVLLEKMCNRDDEAICMSDPNYDQTG
ncbi:hypothetical protein ACLBSM_32775, partial [Klebsiella pneumoniae]